MLKLKKFSLLCVSLELPPTLAYFIAYAVYDLGLIYAWFITEHSYRYEHLLIINLNACFTLLLLEASFKSYRILVSSLRYTIMTYI